MHRSQQDTVETAILWPRTDHRYVALVMVVSTHFSLFLSCSPRRSFFTSHSVFFSISLTFASSISPYRIARRRKEGGRRPEKRGKTRMRSERESCRGLGDKLIVDVRHAPSRSLYLSFYLPLSLSLFLALSLSLSPTDRPTDQQTE